MTGSERAPYFPFWVQDFIHSCRQAAMSAEEIGAYIVFLCKQWEHGGPVANDTRTLSAYSGWDVRTVRRLTDRLVTLGKIDLVDGQLSNARMTSEIEKYVARVKAAREREERKRQGTSAGLLGEVSGDVREKSGNIAGGLPADLSGNGNENKGTPTTGGTTKTALPDPEPESEEEKYMPTEGVGIDAGEPEGEAKKVRSYSAAFEAFWQAFPVKDGKWDAFDKSWRKLSAEDREAATVGAKLYAERVKRENIEKPKWAQGWLSGRRWEAEATRAAPSAAEATRAWWQNPEKLRSVTRDQWLHLIGKHANGTWPVRELGPPPASQKCVVPEAVIRELNLLDRYDHNGIARGAYSHG